MDIPNTFKNRTGAIQLLDLDNNFETIRVAVNLHDEQIATLDSKITTLNAKIDNFSAVPYGCILIWSGTIATIPTGWRICDGTNNTPDLRDKFVIGAKLDSNGRAQTTITGAATYQGGSKDAQTVAHSHTATSTANSTASTGNNTETWDFTFRAQDGATIIPVSANNITLTQQYDTGRMTTSNNYVSNTQLKVAHSYTHNHTVSVSTSVSTAVASEGASGTNGNLPPYYSLAFIMKVS